MGRINVSSDVVDGNLRPLGCIQSSDLSTANAGITVPTDARVAIIQAIDNDIAWRDDGDDATNSAGGSFGGLILAAGASFLYVGDLSALSIIEAVSGSTAYANIAYYA